MEVCFETHLWPLCGEWIRGDEAGLREAGQEDRATARGDSRAKSGGNGHIWERDEMQRTELDTCGTAVSSLNRSRRTHGNSDCD